MIRHCTIAIEAMWLGLVICGVGAVVAQGHDYRLPAEQVMRALDAAPTPAVALSPGRDRMLLVDRQLYPPIADLAQPMLRLAGSRFNPSTNGPFELREYVGLSVLSLESDAVKRVDLPQGLHLGWPIWSPDGAMFGFTVTHADGIELWIGEAASGNVRRLTDRTLNAAGDRPFRWMPDSRRLLVRLVPSDRPALPKRVLVPTGPVIQETRGSKAPLRTFQDLLNDRHDEILYEHLCTAQLAMIDAIGGQQTPIGPPGVYSQADASPDGEHLLVHRIVPPYSYLVPAFRFPLVVEVWDTHGRVIAEIARLPLREEIPIEGVATGPRGIEWHDLLPATLLWAEALDDGDPKKKAAHRDRLMRLSVPFTGEAQEWLRTEHRWAGTAWLDDEPQETALVSEYDRDRRWRRTWLYRADAQSPRLVWDQSIHERYNDPGSPVTKRTAAGRSVVRVEGGSIYLSGDGATPQGDRPFFDRMSLETFQTKRLWRCGEGTYEYAIDLVGEGVDALLIRAESPTDPPNYFVYSPGDGRRKRVTDFPDPAPQLREISKRLVTYQRSDGVQLSATLYLPPGYDGQTRLPLIVWAYPREYTEPSTAGQVAGSPYRFTRIDGASHLFLLLEGYAVLDGAGMPVIGDPETVNDTFVQQVVDSAAAAIEAAVELGVADPDRVGIGGHSYGAFMTATLLAHSDLFKAGIARSGAYNRTLTPFGFQAERRTFWEAPQAYLNLSPFTHADKINEPVLIIHGQIDANAGTFPMQSERLYQAIKGHGGTARLVMLPFEDHGYRARESVLHVVAEMADWFNAYVKQAPTNSSAPTP